MELCVGRDNEPGQYMSQNGYTDQNGWGVVVCVSYWPATGNNWTSSDNWKKEILTTPMSDGRTIQKCNLGGFWSASLAQAIVMIKRDHSTGPHIYKEEEPVSYVKVYKPPPWLQWSWDCGHEMSEFRTLRGGNKGKSRTTTRIQENRVSYSGANH